MRDLIDSKWWKYILVTSPFWLYGYVRILEALL